MTAGIEETVYILYGTSACHLCEVAEGMVTALQSTAPGFRFTRVDIAGSEELFQRYGVRIPVLRHPDGSELGWPFTPEQLAAFVAP